MTEYVPTLPDVEELSARVHRIRQVQETLMQEGIHYGVTPGIPKPSLLQPGAEVLAVAFDFDLQVTVESQPIEQHQREYTAHCVVVHAPTGQRRGDGYGICSTLESAYRYRNAERTCPQCGKPAIIKGRQEYGGGYLCFSKRGGCGAKFADTDPAILNQALGQVENPNPADTYNAAMKKAVKRAVVDGVKRTLGVSDIFTQDMEPGEPMAEVVPQVPPPSPPLRTQPKPQGNGEEKREEAKPRPTPVAPPPPGGFSSPTVTKGQLAIVLQYQKNNAVPDAAFNQYLLSTFGVEEASRLRQADLNPVLMWLESPVRQNERKG